MNSGEAMAWRKVGDSWDDVASVLDQVVSAEDIEAQQLSELRCAPAAYRSCNFVRPSPCCPVLLPLWRLDVLSIAVLPTGNTRASMHSSCKSSGRVLAEIGVGECLNCLKSAAAQLLGSNNMHAL